MKGSVAKLMSGVGRPVTVGPQASVVIGPSPSVVVEAPPRFAWDEKRWTRHERNGYVEYCGHYPVLIRRTGVRRQFPGSIITSKQGIAAYIHNPPPEMRRHSHGACLQMSNPPWFRIHWTRPPATVDDALLFMERMLHESFN